MKWQLSKNNVWLYIIIIGLIAFIIINNGFHIIDKKHTVKEIIDTQYNHIVLDSIKYNIIVKDSIIIKIKYRYEEEIIKANSLNDSASVELFKRLCTDDYLYGGDYTR